MHKSGYQRHGQHDHAEEERAMRAHPDGEQEREQEVPSPIARPAQVQDEQFARQQGVSEHVRPDRYADGGEEPCNQGAEERDPGVMAIKPARDVLDHQERRGDEAEPQH